MFLPDGIVGRWSENRTDGVFDWSAFDHTLTSDAPIVMDKVVLKPKVQIFIALVFTMPRKMSVLFHRIHIMLVFTYRDASIALGFLCEGGGLSNT